MEKGTRRVVTVEDEEEEGVGKVWAVEGEK
jgi:hypothetical protein